MSTLIEQAGGSPQKQPRYVPIFMDRAFTGLYTQRAVLHDPSDVYTARFYGGRPDALLTGLNIELTNRLTLQRRPGTTAFVNQGIATVGFLYPTTPDRAYSFQLSDGTIQVIIDTGSSGSLAITAAANASGGNTVYTGTFPLGGSNAYVGLSFLVSGFPTAHGEDNGTFVCTASTTTTLTLANAAGTAVSNAATAVTAGGVWKDNQDGTATLLYAKSPGAGQTYFQAVAGVLYFGDGIDTKKYTPLNTNGTIWKWGIDAPTAQPGVSVVQSGSASTQWQASTVFSTMGLTKDTNGTPQIWQIISVNNPSNTQFGTTGTGEPAWNTTLWGTTTDNGVTWVNAGLLNDWLPNTFYTDMGTINPNSSAPGAIAVQSVTCIYGNFKNSGNLGKTEGPSTEPHFSGAHPGANYFEANNSGNNGLNWFPLFNWSAGSSSLRWKQSHTYPTWYSGSPTGATKQIQATDTTCCITGNLPSTPTNPVYLQIPKVGGTSGSGYNPFPASQAIGTVVTDNQITWMCLGQAAWQSGHTYVPWTAQGNTFGCVYDGTNFQVATKVTGVSGGGTPSWNTGYGSTTIDGGVTWTCVGPTVNWAAAQTWNFPTSGFAPPTSAQRYGGSIVESTITGVNYLEAVISSGTSSSSPPTWPLPTATPPTVSDGSITWQTIAVASSLSLAWSFGLCYAYSYKARPLTDSYSPAPLGGGLIPPGLQVGGPNASFATPFTLPPTGSETNVISSASPPNQIVGSNSGAVNTISGVYSSDPQCDTIVIWRSADSASGSANMFELTEIPNIPAQGGQTWQFQDFLPSVATGIYPGLNVLLPAPIDGVNNPPLSTYLPQVFNYQRIWGSNGQSVNFSGGPDTAVGNPNEAFNVSDELPFLAPVVRLVRSPQGIITFLTDSIEMIGGGPATATFFSVTMCPGVGLLSYNACDVFAGEVFFFSTDNMFRVITPNLNVSNFGFPLGDQFANQPTTGVSDATWNPSNVYVAVHQNGTDNCIFVADGSTGWYRLNPHQVPGAAQGPEPIWSPFAAITGGCKMVQSVEVSPGIKQLLIGPTSGGNDIVIRNLTVFTDEGTPYGANFVMGSITLARPGEIALLKFLEFDFSGTSFQPTISYLLNEISGSFTSFVNGANGVPQFDPPSLYGKTITPASYSPNRYYFGSNAAVARCRHMQIKVDFGSSSTTGDELYTMTIFGRKMVEG